MATSTVMLFILIIVVIIFLDVFYFFCSCSMETVTNREIVFFSSLPLSFSVSIQTTGFVAALIASAAIVGWITTEFLTRGRTINSKGKAVLITGIPSDIYLYIFSFFCSPFIGDFVTDLICENSCE